MPTSRNCLFHVYAFNELWDSDSILVEDGGGGFRTREYFQVHLMEERRERRGLLLGATVTDVIKCSYYE